MADEAQDDASKTEDPTAKRLEEAHKKGQTISSRELNHFFMMLALTFFIAFLAAHTSMQLKDLLADFIIRPDMFEMTSAGVFTLLRDVSIGMMLALALPLLLTLVAAIAPAVVQGKWVFAMEQVRPKWQKVSPFAGFNRIFGMKAFVEFIKNMLKISMVGIVAVMAVWPYHDLLPQLAANQKSEMLGMTRHLSLRMMIGVCIALFLLSIVDYVYQRITFLKSMRMSKQEIKDEHKQQEGDPLIKGKIRQLRRDRARKRMMANVPKADVIITNPTHYAIALRYDSATMQVPKLLAKGTDEIAARIREIALTHKIPIVRNPPLARVLYDTTEIDDDIPVAQYQAVAKIIGYVYKLKGKPLGKAKPVSKKGKK